jgi:hypothetical protein
VLDADPSFRPVRQHDGYLALEDMDLIGDSGEDQREIESGEGGPQGLLDAARVLAQAYLLAFGALEAPVR